MGSLTKEKLTKFMCYRNIVDQTSPAAHYSGESIGGHFQKHLPLYFVTVEIIKIQITEIDDNVSLVFFRV